MRRCSRFDRDDVQHFPVRSTCIYNAPHILASHIYFMLSVVYYHRSLITHSEWLLTHEFKWISHCRDADHPIATSICLSTIGMVNCVEKGVWECVCASVWRRLYRTYSEMWTSTFRGDSRWPPVHLMKAARHAHSIEVRWREIVMAICSPKYSEEAKAAWAGRPMCMQAISNTITWQIDSTSICVTLLIVLLA